MRLPCSSEMCRLPEGSTAKPKGEAKDFSVAGPPSPATVVMIPIVRSTHPLVERGGAEEVAKAVQGHVEGTRELGLDCRPLVPREADAAVSGDGADRAVDQSLDRIGRQQESEEQPWNHQDSSERVPFAQT